MGSIGDRQPPGATQIVDVTAQYLAEAERLIRAKSVAVAALGISHSQPGTSLRYAMPQFNCLTVLRIGNR